MPTAGATSKELGLDQEPLPPDPNGFCNIASHLAFTLLIKVACS